MRDLTYWYWLRDVKGVGPLRHRLLLAAFGSPENVFEAGMTDYLQVGQVGEKLARSLEEGKNRLDTAKRNAEADSRKALEFGARIVTIDESDYPPILKREEAVAPIVLYAIGDVAAIPERAVAIVGSRRASREGQQRAQVLARQFAEADWGVVSGLALGIDAAAHRGVLEAQGCTIAVLGCGVDFFYPPENRSLQRRIADEGLVISEYPFGTRPLAEFLQKRNKLIVGLSEAVIVGECPSESGALIAAKEAEERNKPVFAFVPSGSLGPSSEGSVALIRERRAFGLTPADSAEDVVGAIAQYLEPRVCVLFDLDGVLADTSDAMTKGYQYALRVVLDKSVKKSEIRVLLGLSPRSLLGRYDETRVDELESAYRSYFDANWTSHVRMSAAVREVLAQLFKLRIPVGLVTSRNKTETEKILRHLGLDKTMSTVVTWGSTARKKPHAHPILHALVQMPSSCNEVVYVGDRAEDVQAARAAGIAAVGACWYSSTNVDELSGAKPDYMCSTPGRLMDLLLMLHRRAWAGSAVNT